MKKKKKKCIFSILVREKPQIFKRIALPSSSREKWKFFHNTWHKHECSRSWVNEPLHCIYFSLAGYISCRARISATTLAHRLLLRELSLLQRLVGSFVAEHFTIQLEVTSTSLAFYFSPTTCITSCCNLQNVTGNFSDESEPFRGLIEASAVNSRLCRV